MDNTQVVPTLANARRIAPTLANAMRKFAEQEDDAIARQIALYDADVAAQDYANDL